MAEQSADLILDLEEEGETISTKNIPSGQGRVVIDARMINYDIEKTSVTRVGHRLFLRKDVAVHLRQHPADICELTGYATNDKAGQAYNEKVAMNRAEEAAEFLLREGVDNSQIFIGRAQVVGYFGQQRAEDRSVDVKVLEPLSTNFRCRMVTWNEVRPPKPDVDWPALVITGNDIDVEGFFYFLPNDALDIGRFSPIVPSLSGFVKPNIPVSIKDFNESFATFFKLPPDMLRMEIEKFIKFPTVAFKVTTFVNNVRLNWDDHKESVVGRLFLGRTVVSGRDTQGQNQPIASPVALQSQMLRRKAGLQG
jgi:hypothetical protein